MSKERLEGISNIAIFLGLMEKGEIVYINGRLHRWLKLTSRYKGLGRKNTGGYMQLTRKINGKDITALEHRIVYCYFNDLLDMPENLYINHLNGIKTDNRIENLELVSHSDNLKHAYRMKLRKSKRGEENPSSKLTEEEVIRIRRKLERNEKTVKEVSEKYKVSTTVIYKIRSGESWKHLI